MKDIHAALARSPFIMAPMAGISDAAYRLMAKRGGARICCTEMVSVSGIHFKSRATLELLKPFTGLNRDLKEAIVLKKTGVPFVTEGPLIVQLFGSDPALFVEAVPTLLEIVGERLAWIDINMACPVKKVRKIGAGAELLQNPVRAIKIVSALKSATNIPISVKMRLLETLQETRAFAQRLEEAGVDAITLHGRTAAQFYHGASSLEEVAKVGQVLSVPLIASGDMFSAAAGASALQQRGIQGVMFARGTLGNPWIFQDAEALLSVKRLDGAPQLPRHFAHTKEERLDAFVDHVRLIEMTQGQILRARTLFCHYTKDLPHARHMRTEIMRAQTPDEFVSVALRYKRALQEHELFAASATHQREGTSFGEST